MENWKFIDYFPIKTLPTPLTLVLLGGGEIVIYNKRSGRGVRRIVSYNFFAPKNLGEVGGQNVTIDVGHGNLHFSHPPLPKFCICLLDLVKAYLKVTVFMCFCRLSPAATWSRRFHRSYLKHTHKIAKNISKSYLNHSQNAFQIHSVLKENYAFHHLHNIYPPLGAMADINVSYEVQADKHMHFAGTSSAEVFQLYIYIAWNLKTLSYSDIKCHNISKDTINYRNNIF